MCLANNEKTDNQAIKQIATSVTSANFMMSYALYTYIRNVVENDLLFAKAIVIVIIDTVGTILFVPCLNVCTVYRHDGMSTYICMLFVIIHHQSVIYAS